MGNRIRNCFYKNQMLSSILALVILMLIPFRVERLNVSGSEITFSHAVLYSTMQVEVLGFSKTKICFFPANIELRKNIVALEKLVGNVNDLFEGLLE